MPKSITLQLALLSLACSLFLASNAIADSPQVVNVPAGDLITGLQRLAKQTGVELVYRPEQLKGLRTRGVQGKLSSVEAVRRVLEGTTLTLHTDSSGALLITTADPGSTAVFSPGFQPPSPTVGEGRGEASALRLAQSNTTSVASGGGAGNATAQEPSASGGLEEIVVTASKRYDETLKEVPGAMTALTGRTLDNLGVVDFQDYRPYVPGLSSNLGTFGQPGTYSVILRGLNTGATQPTATVGYYLDDMPLTPSATNSTGGIYAPDPDFGDVDHIEVLKGPQATLYGASTLGGLIKIVSKKPDLTTFSGDASVGGVTVDGGGTGYTARGAVNLPLIQNVLAVRLSGYDREDPGFADNAFTGQTNVNLDHSYGGRLSLRYEPTDKLTFDLTGLIQQLHSSGGTLEYLNSTTLQPIYGYDKYSDFSNTTAATQLTLFGLSANYDTGWGTLTNSLGFGRFFSDNKNLPFTTAFGPFLPLPSPPIGVEGSALPDSKKTTDELRFTSTRMNNFLGQAGLFYTYENVSNPNTAAALSFPGAVALPAPINPLLSANRAGSYREYAGFADLTYYFTDALDATAGARYSHNQQTAVNTSAGLLGGGPVSTISAGSSSSDASYLFDVRYRVSQQLSTYLRVASAYRPGGPQTLIAPGVPPTFGPDTDWNYEVGAKGLWLDGKLNTNLAVYYIDWRNIQIGTIYSGPLVITGNGGNAKSEGVEFDGSYEPVRGLVFGANASYDEAAITSANPLNTAGARVGDPLPYTPKWSGALTGDYSFPLTPNVKGGLGASWSYTGWRYSSFSADPTNTREVIPSYALFGVRGHVDWNRTSLALNVENLANKQTFTNIEFVRVVPGQPVPGFGVPLQPLTVRLTLSTSF
ncbi:MAG: TonB-dependent receptor domain-containing protein [Steroidobacteraceae bacterium]